MKYLIVISLTVFLTCPWQSVMAASSMVENTISESEFNQYIIINCSAAECGGIFDLVKSMEGAVVGNIETKIQPSADFSSSEAEINESTIEPVANSTPEESSTNRSEAATTSDSSANTTGNAASQSQSTGEETTTNNNMETNSQSAVATISPGMVIVNEIISVPLAGEKEWVELYNTTNNSIDLSKWQLEEGSGKKTELFGQISGLGYLVFDKSYLNNDGDIVILRDPAGNIIDQVAYGKWDDGNAADNAPTPSTGNSLSFWQGSYVVSSEATPNAKNVVNEVAASNSEQTVAASTTTTTAANTQATTATATSSTTANTTTATTTAAAIIPQYDFSAQVRVNEILPDPVGSDEGEWIELYNDDERAINLLGWTLDDAAGGSLPYKFKDTVMIESKGFLVLSKPKTGIVLNNSTDEVNLFDPNGTLVSNFTYSGPKEGTSSSYFETGWNQTPILSPGEENKKADLQAAAANSDLQGLDNADPAFVETTAGRQVRDDDTQPLKAVTVAEIKKLPLKTKVVTSGQVAVLPGVFSKNMINIIDRGAGTQVYFPKSDWPEFTLGDWVKVTGTISESSGNRRISLKDQADLEIFSSDELVAPEQIDSITIGEQVLDSFVQIEGKLVAKEKNKLILADERGEFSVYLKQGAKIDSKVLSEGDELRVMGVIGQVSDEPFLMPRSQDDIANLTAQAKPVLGEVAESSDKIAVGFSTKTRVIVTLAILSLIGSLLLAGLKWRGKIRQIFNNLRQRVKVPAFGEKN